MTAGDDGGNAARSLQLGLFGDDPPPALDPIPPPDPALVELAGRLPRGLRFGTSSWTFPGWRDVYRRSYPSDAAFQRESLAEYARHPLMGAAGIDRSFYAPLDEATYDAYAARLPPGFPTVQKLWSELSTWVFPRHPREGERAGRRNPAFLDPQVVAERVVTPLLARFADHAGPIVIQVPPLPPGADPDPRGFADALDRFFHDAPAGVAGWAVELRNRRLFTPRYLTVLARHGATHVPTWWSRMPALSEQWSRVREATADARAPLVVRLMLPPGARYDDLKRAYHPFDRVVAPAPAMRDEVVALVQDALESGVPEVTVLVNNKAEGSAPGTIEALAKALADS